MGEEEKSREKRMNSWEKGTKSVQKRRKSMVVTR